MPLKRKYFRTKLFAPKSVAMSALITALVATGPLSTDMYLPALPEIGDAFSADTAHVQWTLSIFLIGIAVGQLALGPLSDRFGRRPVLVGGMALYFFASIACVFAPTIAWLTAARFVQAIGVCAGGVVGRAVVRDIYGREEAARTLAHISTAIAVAPLIAPLVGGHLTVSFGWGSIFWTMSAIGLALFILTGFTLPETIPNKELDALNPKRFAANYKSLLASSSFRGYLFATAFCFSGLFAFISGSSFVLIETLGMAPDHFGFAFAFVVVGFMVGSQMSARMVKRLGVARIVALGGQLAMVMGFVALALNLIGTPSVFSVVAPMTLYLVSVGFILPSALSGAIGPYPKMAGAASALVGFVQMAMAGVSGALVGAFHDGTPVPMMTVVAVCGVLCWLFARNSHELEDD